MKKTNYLMILSAFILSCAVVLNVNELIIKDLSHGNIVFAESGGGACLYTGNQEAQKEPEIYSECWYFDGEEDHFHGYIQRCVAAGVFDKCSPTWCLTQNPGCHEINP